MTKWLGALLALFIMTVALTAVAGSAVTVESLKDLIAKELPAGSSKERVMAFVKQYHLGEAEGGEGGFSPKTNAIYGIIRNVQPWYMWESWIGFRTDITLIFYLDSEGKLKSYTVEKVHTWF